MSNGELESIKYKMAYPFHGQGIFTSPYWLCSSLQVVVMLLKAEAVSSLFGATLAYGFFLPFNGGHSSLRLDHYDTY